MLFDDKMKILLFTDALGAGGAQRQLVGLAVLLKNAGHKVKLATYHQGVFYSDVLSKNEIEHIVVTETNNKLKRIVDIAQFCKNEKPNVLIAYQASPSIIACIAKIMGGKFKLIVSERNTNQRFSVNDRLRFFLYRWADHVVPNSYSQAEFIAKHAKWLKEDVSVIVNFVDTERFVPVITRKSISTFNILSIGRMTPQKNVKAYIEAVSTLVKEDLPLHIDWYGYADRGGGYYSECLSMVKDYGLEPYFVFHQPVDDVVKLYQEADVFCLPSIYEGTPNVVCEAMSCGLPILCSDVCDNSRYVKDNGILFDPKSVNSIATAIRNFYKKTESEKKEMGVKSRSLAVEQFSQEFFLKQYLSLIHG